MTKIRPHTAEGSGVRVACRLYRWFIMIFVHEKVEVVVTVTVPPPSNGQRSHDVSYATTSNGFPPPCEKSAAQRRFAAVYSPRVAASARREGPNKTRGHR